MHGCPLGHCGPTPCFRCAAADGFSASPPPPRVLRQRRRKLGCSPACLNGSPIHAQVLPTAGWNRSPSRPRLLAEVVGSHPLSSEGLPDGSGTCARPLAAGAASSASTRAPSPGRRPCGPCRTTPHRDSVHAGSRAAETVTEHEGTPVGRPSPERTPRRQAVPTEASRKGVTPPRGWRRAFLRPKQGGAFPGCIWAASRPDSS